MEILLGIRQVPHLTTGTIGRYPAFSAVLLRINLDNVGIFQRTMHFKVLGKQAEQYSSAHPGVYFTNLGINILISVHTFALPFF
jgi:hypothetical protein